MWEYFCKSFGKRLISSKYKEQLNNNNKKNPLLKIGKGFENTSLQRKYTMANRHKRCSNLWITGKTANQHYNMILLHKH